MNTTIGAAMGERRRAWKLARAIGPLALCLATACAPVAKPGREPIVSPAAEPAVIRIGNATYYADSFEGRRTATGERFRQELLTAATNVLPLGTWATVTNRETGASVEIVVNDRMPKSNRKATFDLSWEAADRIGMVDRGIVAVTVEAKPSRQPTPALREAVRRLASPSGE